MSETRFGPGRADDTPLPAAFGTDLERGLAVDPDALARVRTTITAEFRRQAAAGNAAGPVAGAHSPAPARWRAAFRPLAAFGLAGAVLLGSVGLVAANSGPGEAFYDLRLAVEGLNLLAPASHLDRLQERLDEASRESDNAAAVTAALRAYKDELQRALDEATDEAGRRAILDRLEVHRAVLDALAQTVPDSATGGLEQALSQVGEAEQNLRGQDAASPLASPTPKKASPDRSPKPTPTRRPSTR